jgi:AcrR family transcriptional regulator
MYIDSMVNARSDDVEPSTPRRRTLRDEQKRFTRTRLLETAAEVIARRGFAGATIGEIVEKANASRATFYLHFKNKEELVSALVDDTRADVAAYSSRLDNILGSGSRDDLRDFIRDVLHWFQDHDVLFRAQLSAVVTVPGFGEKVQQRLTEHMPKYLARIGPDRQVEAELRVWSLVMQLGRVHVNWRFGKSMPEVDEELMTDVLTDIWMHGLDPDGSASVPAKARRTPRGRTSIKPPR